LVLVVLGAAGAAYGFGLRAGNVSDPKNEGPPPEAANYHTIIKHPRIDGSLSPGGSLFLVGEAAEHITRARIVVEVKAWTFGKWATDRFRTEVAPITDKLTGDRVNVPLVNYSETPSPADQNHYFWGDPKANFPLYFGPLLVRIFITNSNNQDQAPYDLILFRGADVKNLSDGTTTPNPIYVLQDANLDWKKPWETK
jgi:hypothetical protein